MRALTVMPANMKTAAAVPLKIAAGVGSFVARAHPKRAPTIKLRMMLRRVFMGISIGKG
jgi:hypothetical protein